MTILGVDPMGTDQSCLILELETKGINIRAIPSTDCIYIDAIPYKHALSHDFFKLQLQFKRDISTGMTNFDIIMLL